jgi:putative exporter of polyketide antibiotics
LTLFWIALRLSRTGAIATAAIGIANAFGQTLGYAQFAGQTPADRAAFAHSMELLGRQLMYLLPVPAQLDTMAGYVDWRQFGIMPVFLGFWALMAAAGAGRGDEERGLVEGWLVAGVSRGAYVASRVAAFALAAVLVIALTCVPTAIGAAVGREPVPWGALALQGVALLALTGCLYGIALFAAQLTVTRRGAVGLGAAVLVALFMVNSAARSGGLEAIRWLSPFWAYDRSHPLLRGGSLDGPATLGLAAAATGLVAIAWLAFRARDLGAPLVRVFTASGPPRIRPSRDPFLRPPVVALIDMQRAWVALWMAGVAVLAVFLLSFIRTLVDSLSTVPSMRPYLERAGLGDYTSFVGAIWLSTLLLLVSAYAIAQANGWAAEDAEGRLETVLAQPVSRRRVVLERLVALLATATLIVAAGSLATLAAASAADIDLDVGRLALASVLMLAVVFAFGGLGAAGAAWRPRLAVAILASVAIAGYFTQQFAPLFDWPDWVRDLSLYALYGQPLVRDVDWPRIAALLGVGLVGTIIALAAMERRDVGR